MIRTLLLNSLFIVSLTGYAQSIRVSDNHRLLVTSEGEPFFWMADTAWELFHRCTLEDIDYYLSRRKEQGFNVIQAVALAELDGLHSPNAYGELPLLNDNPETPNEAYFDLIDKVIDVAREKEMYIALLPTWGDKVFKHNWGTGPEIFNVANARSYGEWIGKRFAAKQNIIWVLGGDRNPRENTDDADIWRAMAEGIATGAGGYDQTLMTFHPQPKPSGGSSTWFHQDQWLDFNMHQTGHCPDKGTYRHIKHDYNLTPVKPVIDGEPLYEDHPNCFNAKELGYSVADDIRRIMYWNVFAGAAGQTYGCHDVWQMYADGNYPVNGPLRPWKVALDLPMANQVKHLKSLMLSRPYLTRVPDAGIVRDPGGEMDFIIATRDSEGTYAMIYFPSGQAATLNLTSLQNEPLTSTWYDPRTGSSFPGPEIISRENVSMQPPSSGRGNDWVLIVDVIN